MFYRFFLIQNLQMAKNNECFPSKKLPINALFYLITRFSKFAHYISPEAVLFMQCVAHATHYCPYFLYPYESQEKARHIIPQLLCYQL